MLINGIESNHIAGTDRGLAYGDGIFSTIKVEFGVVQLWNYHLDRLQRGALRLFFPKISWDLLEQEVKTVAKTLNQQAQAIIKIIITRGSGGRGYSASGCDTPLRIISSHAFPCFYQTWQKEGINLVLCQQIISSNSQLAGLKTLNRLEQVLIKHELESKNALEGIVCDNEGNVIEACTANLFIYKNEQWLTPLLDRCGVEGVQRRHVMAVAKQAGIAVTEVQMKVDDLLSAQALCLTNALMGIIAVNKFQSYSYPKSGLLAIQKLQSLIQQREQINGD